MVFSHLMFKLNNIAIISGYVKILCSPVPGAIFHSVLQSLCWISLTLVLSFSQLGAELNLNPRVRVHHEKGLNLVLHVYLLCTFTIYLTTCIYGNKATATL